MEQKDSIKTKDKILQASIDLFAEKGYGNVSMREIAKEVGIKASSLYKHYESKNDILESIFQLFQESLSLTNLPAVGLKDYLKTVSAEEYLNQGFELFRQTMWAPTILKISRIITTEQQRNQSVKNFFVEEMIRKPHVLMQQVFDMMIENGSVEPIDTTVAAEEYNAYIIYLYFEQNYLKDAPDVTEIEQKMKQHNAFFANHVLKAK
ncbi:MAG: TetR/AcrR family transcriptional regulator [Thermoclostridium sp.]|nr:TetR/AcrR family transcriptional regulator [Thermoclostridium sp.]